MPQSRELTEEIGDSWSKCAQPRPLIDHAKRIGAQRPSPSLIVMRQKLGLIRRHIYVRRAFRFAGFTRKAQIERFLDVLVFPAVAEDFALQQLEQHMRAAA